MSHAASDWRDSASDAPARLDRMALVWARALGARRPSSAECLRAVRRMAQILRESPDGGCALPAEVRADEARGDDGPARDGQT